MTTPPLLRSTKKESVASVRTPIGEGRVHPLQPQARLAHTTMARTTRSTATTATTQPDKDKLSPASDDAPSTSLSKNKKSKKRKRDSIIDHEDQPATKLPRQEDDISHSTRTEDLQSPPPTISETYLDSDLAHQILETLEMYANGTNHVPLRFQLTAISRLDTQGLLDRVFPLSEDHPESSCSLRTLLQDSQSYSLHALRVRTIPAFESSHLTKSFAQVAIQRLYPISLNSRSSPNTPSAQQLRFCNLALSLLDQASQLNPCIPLDTGDVLTADRPESSAAATTRHKYALMQKLPSGEWWTSLNSDIISQGTDLKGLSTGHAELVSIFPAPSSSSLPPEPRTLKHYTSNRTPSGTSTPVPPKHRYVSRGSFLDYGPYSSFAPTFDQGGREVGRTVYGEVLWRERGNRLRLRALKKKQLAESNLPDAIMEEPSSIKQGPSSGEDWHETLKDFLSISSLTSALDNLEVRDSVQELLERNAKALARLEEMQLRRYGDPLGFKPAEVGSEEWETGTYSRSFQLYACLPSASAHAILDSLTLLMSLRPKSAASESLIPPLSVVRKVYRSLPLDPSPGYHGTLPPIPASRTTALRDDNTIHLKSGALAAIDPALTSTPSRPVVPAKVQPTNITAAPTPTHAHLHTPTVTMPTTLPYTYPAASYQNTVPYASTYGTYTPTQGSYYQSYGSTTTGYSSWYGGAYGQVGTPGRGTPTPITTAVPVQVYPPQGGTYQPQPHRAVANTMLSTPTKGGWGGGVGATTYATPVVLPSQVRNGSYQVSR